MLCTRGRSRRWLALLLLGMLVGTIDIANARRGRPQIPEFGVKMDEYGVDMSKHGRDAVQLAFIFASLQEIAGSCVQLFDFPFGAFERFQTASEGAFDKI
eukprot:SAG31_NODE_6195_length_2128_cov_1.620503_2_plen_100_part_00